MEKINLTKLKAFPVIMLVIALFPLLTAQTIEPMPIAPGEEVHQETLTLINKTQLGNDIMELARKIALPHHIAYLNISERIGALKDILHKKNVYTPEDLKKFIALNNIDVNLFNKKVDNSVNALSTAQYHLLLAYNLFQQDKLEDAQNHLILAQRQYKIFQDYVADLSYMVDSWKALQKHKFYAEDFIGQTNNTVQETVYPDIQKVEMIQETEQEPADEIVILRPQKQFHPQKSFLEALWEWFASLFN